MTAYAAVDLGAQSGRVAVGRFDGTRLATTEMHRFPNGPVRAGDTLHWDILGLYREVLEGLRAVAAHEEVASVGVDSWGVGVGRRGRQGGVVPKTGPTPHRGGAPGRGAR